MAKLNEVISSIYGALKDGSAPIYSEYEKIPVVEHEDIYAVCGIEKIVLKKEVYVTAAKYFSADYQLKIRILGKPDTDPVLLYEMLDSKILDKLSENGFYVKSAEISAPDQNYGLRRIVLECKAEISGRTEVLNESQS